MEATCRGEAGWYYNMLFLLMFTGKTWRLIVKHWLFPVITWWVTLQHSDWKSIASTLRDGRISLQIERFSWTKILHKLVWTEDLTSWKWMVMWFWRNWRCPRQGAAAACSCCHLPLSYLCFCPARLETLGTHQPPVLHLLLQSTEVLHCAETLGTELLPVRNMCFIYSFPF